MLPESFFLSSKLSSFSEKFSLFRMLPTSSLSSELSSFQKTFLLEALFFSFNLSLSDASDKFSFFRAFLPFQKTFLSDVSGTLSLFSESSGPLLSFPPPFLSLLV